MDENLNKDNENQNQITGEDKRNDDIIEKSDDINRFNMDEKGNIRNERTGTAVMTGVNRTYVILGWISAALAAFISPLFAALGITFGVLVNRQSKGSGNAIIITNVVLALINIVFGLVLTVALRRMVTGY